MLFQQLFKYVAFSDKINSLTYALSSPQRMLIISGYTRITSKAMHRSQRLPYLLEGKEKNTTIAEASISLNLRAPTHGYHHILFSITYIYLV